MTTNQSSVNVRINFGELDTVLDWCERNCQGIWNIETIIEYAGFVPGTYEFIFQDDQDATIFALRWA